MAEAFERNAYYVANIKFEYMDRMSLKIESLKSRNYPNLANDVASNLIGSRNLQDPDGGGDWRSQQLPFKVRDTIIKKIVDILISCGHADNGEITEIARVIEEKIYYAAYSQADYLSRMSLKIVKLELQYQNIECEIASDSMGVRILQGLAELQMDGSNLRSPSHVSAAQDGGGNWRDKHLTAAVRNLIFDQMVNQVKHLPSVDPNAIPRIAKMFEGQIYEIANNQFDYHRRTILKILEMKMAAAFSSLGLSNVEAPASFNLQLQVPSQYQQENLLNI